jgi:hypothetical protein
MSLGWDVAAVSIVSDGIAFIARAPDLEYQLQVTRSFEPKQRRSFPYFAVVRNFGKNVTCTVNALLLCTPVM